jgi:hypothetical protein
MMETRNGGRHYPPTAENDALMIAAEHRIPHKHPPMKETSRRKDVLVTVGLYGNALEAELARGRLLSEGVDAFIFKDDCGGMRPYMQLTAGVRLKVLAENAVRATILLHPVDPEPYGTVDPEDAPFTEIHTFLKRAIGWLLIGVVLGVGWVTFPLSFHSGSKALRVYRQHAIEDDDLKRRILRIRTIALLLTVGIWAIFIL